MKATRASGARSASGQVKLGKVDCTEAKVDFCSDCWQSQFLGSMFGIHGFPSLKFIADGKMPWPNAIRITSDVEVFLLRAAKFEALSSSQPLP